MKLPRDISGAQAVRALKRAGFDVERQTGSHVRMSRGAARVTVPNHDAIAPKTLQSILRQAGLTPDQFRALL